MIGYQGEPGGAGTVGLLAGCIQDEWFRPVNRAAVTLLEMAGHEVVVPKGQTCCGALAAHDGHWEAAHRYEERNLAALAGHDMVVATAAGCSAHLADYGWPSGVTPLDVTVAVARAIDEGRLPRVETANGTIAIQDPCHLRHAQRVMAELEAALAPEDLVISDVGAHKLWVAKAYGARLPNTVIVSNGFAAMGIGLPGAIAAKLAEPQRRVVTVTGDGGCLMNVQELETARRLELAFVVLVMRDDGYGVIRWKQQKRFGRTAGVDLGNPDLVALAEAFGCRGFRVESAGALRPALEAALASPVPALVDCPVDYAENDRLVEL